MLGAEADGWLARRRAVAADRLELLRMLGQASPWLVAAAAVTALASAVVPVALLLASGLLSDRIATASAGGEHADLSAVYRAFALVMGLFLLAEVLAPVQGRLRWLVTKRVDGRLRRRVIDATLVSDLTRLHDPDYLEALGRVRGLVRWSATPGGGAAALIGVAREYLTGLGAAILVARYQPGVAVLAVVAALVLRSRWRRSILRIVDVWQSGHRDRRETWYLTDVGLGRSTAGEVRLFRLRHWLGARIHASGVRAWTPTWRERLLGMGRGTAVHVALTGATALVGLVWAARATARGSLGIGDLVVFVPALFAVLAVGRSFGDDMAVEYGTRTMPAVRTLERFAADAVSADAAGTSLPPAGAPRIDLRGVRFRYPGGERDVLAGVDLSIPAGCSAALVGLNGAGKTTLVRILCGLYQPDAGAVLVDGVDLRQLDRAAWHRVLAPMFQEFLRLPLSVAQNVSVGAVDHAGDHAGVQMALREAHASFADRLASGHDTLLATRYADGTDLSGGQWQRLGVARALFAVQHGARVLLLDEPTSNLDAPSEERVVQRLLATTHGTATTLLVTHRLALARRCDRVLVLEHGRIVEAGSHDELLALGGRYAAAFGVQASLYPRDAADG